MLWEQDSPALLVDAADIIETFDPREYRLPQYVTSGKVPKVNAFLIEGGKEALCPHIIARHPNPLETLLDSIQFEGIEDYVYMDVHDGKTFTLVLFGEMEASGTYARKGKTLTLASEGETMTAEISGKKITWTYENGAKLVFEKK